eukprot:748909-Hanusia_phi.AAC.2
MWGGQSDIRYYSGGGGGSKGGGWGRREGPGEEIWEEKRKVEHFPDIFPSDSLGIKEITPDTDALLHYRS